MIENIRRQVAWLWKHRHTHDDDTTDADINELRVIIQQQEGNPGRFGTGAYIHLTRNATQSIAATGALISWDTVYTTIPRLEFHPDETYPTLSTLPLTEVTIPLDGYYNLAVGLGWDSFTGGGNVKIFRNPSGENLQVWPPADDPGLWTSTNGPIFEGVAPAVPLQAGDTIGVWLDPDDVSSQTLASATLAVYLVDRTRRDDTYFETVMADGPIAYWRLDETSGTTAFDSAGHALGPFDATYTNSPSLNQAGVMDDTTGSPSVDFNAGPYAIGSDWTDLDFAAGAAFSLEAWFNADAWGPGGGEDGVIIEKRFEAAGDGWGLGVNSSGALRFVVDGGASVEASTTSAVLSTSHHVVGTNDGTTLKLYLDGQLVDSVAQVNLVASGVALGIGRGYDPVNEWDGRLDEVAIYDYALDAAQVLNHYVVGSRGF